MALHYFLFYLWLLFFTFKSGHGMLSNCLTAERGSGGTADAATTHDDEFGQPIFYDEMLTLLTMMATWWKRERYLIAVIRDAAAAVVGREAIGHRGGGVVYILLRFTYYCLVEFVAWSTQAVGL